MKIKPHLKEDLKKYLVERVKNEEQKLKVYSACKLSEDEKILLRKSIKEFDWTDVDYLIDENLLAGVLIKKGSKEINISLQGKLSNLKKIVYESD